MHTTADDPTVAGDTWARLEAATGGAAGRSEAALVSYADRLGPDPALADVDDDQLLDRLCRGAAELAASTCRWLDLLGEVVTRRLWVVDGASTPATWLSWRLGIAPATARDHVRVALRLRDLPAVHQRMATGTLSYSKVRAITRIATTETEDLLLRWADAATAAELERIVASTRRVVAAAARTPDSRRDDLGLTRRWRADNTLEITLRLDTADGIVAEQHLDRLTALATADAAEDTATGDRDDDVQVAAASAHVPRRQQAADALLGALAAAVADGPTDTTGLDRHLAVIELSATDLLAAAAGPKGTGGTSASAAAADGDASADSTGSGDAVRMVGSGRGGGRRRPVPLLQLRRLLCTTALDVLAALERPVDLGRTRRDPDTRLRRLVHARDRTCRMPGCGATRWLHLHHVVPWEHGGPTDIDNLVLLCSHHHRLVHEQQWQLRSDGPGRWTFHPPDLDGRHDDQPRPSAAPPATALTDAVLTVLADRARRHDARALLPADHDGYGYDHDLTVEVLAARITAALPQQRLDDLTEAA